MPFTVGVDVGGTNIKLGLVSSQGKIVARSRLATKDFARKEKLIAALTDAIEDLIEVNGLPSKEISGIGIGLPGLIDPEKGLIHLLPNISNWRNVPLKKIIEKRLGILTCLENDVHLIALAEWQFGAGKGYENLICIALGTGVGSGLILNNALYRGEGFAAGEIGHIPLNEVGPSCSCGGYGCFERYVGNQEITNASVKIFKKKLSPHDLGRLAAQGDVRAIRLWQRIGTHIGNGLVGIVNFLNPRLIIIGGGVSNNFKYLAPTIRQIIKSRAMQVQKKMVKVVPARLGDDAGIIGAQVLVKEQAREH